MKRVGKRITFAVALAAALLIAFAAPAFALGPSIQNLTSPTHPDQSSWYNNTDPTFAWDAVSGPVGSCALPDYAHGVALAGAHAYVAEAFSGLQEVDVANPAAPFVAGSSVVPGNPVGVAVAGTYAYVADVVGLEVVDISNAGAPSLAGSCTLPGWAYGVAVAGSYAYVADNYGGLQVVDVSNPAAPVVAASCSLPGNAYAVAVAESYAYVADEWGGLQVVDVSDPAAPFVAGSCSLSDAALAVAVAGSHAYVADDYGGLQVVDVSDPAAPVVAGSCSLPGEAYDVAVAGGYAYVVEAGSGLHAVDVSNPEAPSVVTSYNVIYADCVAVGGSYAYVGGWDGLQVFDVSAHEFSYSYSLDQDFTGEPDQVVDPLAGPAHPSVSYSHLADGTWYFHVRALDAAGNWGPTATFQVNIDTTGPVTMALSYKTTKQGAIWLQYSVSDNFSSECYVTIDIKNPAGKLLKTMDIGWKQCGIAYTAVVPMTLKRGSYRYVVHATDWLGNPESKAGSASFVVR